MTNLNTLRLIFEYNVCTNRDVFPYGMRFLLFLQARKHELVIHFSGITFVAEPDVMLASPMYVEEKTVSKKQEENASSGVSMTGVAFISVFCTLAVVAVALVAFKVSMPDYESFLRMCYKRKTLKLYKR